MKTAGIIAEYNPFHNGHKYHLEKARECTDADYRIVIMSGNFTQRGEPAVIDKYARARMALACGADLVLELPVCYACASAPYFALGAVSILDSLGVVDELVFGSEYGDAGLLETAAHILTEEPDDYAALLRSNLKLGLSYPSAQSKALIDYVSQSFVFEHSNPSIFVKSLSEGLLSSSNDILGMEYCKSLLLRKSAIRPHAILRSGSRYTDDTLTQPFSNSNASSAGCERPESDSFTNAPASGRAPHTGYSSALAIRTALQAGSFADIRAHVPEIAWRLMQDAYGKTFPVFPDMLSSMLHYKLLSEAEGGFTSYLDVSRELSDRICNKLSDYTDFPSFCMLLKTKELTYTRISRSLLHILLNIRKSDIDLYSQFNHAAYARILGFRTESAGLLTAIKANASIPMISKLADAERYLEGAQRLQLQQDIRAAHLYNALIMQQYQTKLPPEAQRQIIRLSSV